MNEEHKMFCPKCKNIYSSEVGTVCPQCGSEMQPYSNMQPHKDIDAVEWAKEKIIKASPIMQKILAITMAILILFLGVLIGRATRISHKKYNELEENRDQYIAERDKFASEKNELQKEYDAYKEKMQPYEAQYEADVKAAEEKAAAEKAEKEAEEKAQREAEERAQKEAEEKAKAEKEAKEAEARANSLGLTVSEFIDKYNVQASQYNIDTAIKPQNTSGTFVSTTVNSYITMNFSTTQDGYINMVYINYTNTGDTTEATIYQLTSVSAAQAIDSGLSYQKGISIMADLATASINNLGSDVSSTNNGIKYTMNSVMGSTITVISK